MYGAADTGTLRQKRSPVPRCQKLLQFYGLVELFATARSELPVPPLPCRVCPEVATAANAAVEQLNATLKYANGFEFGEDAPS